MGWEGLEVVGVVLVVAGALLGGFVQGFSGFGSTLVSLPIFGLALEVRTAVPAGCLMALAINLMQVTRLRRHVQGRDLTWLLVANVPGMALGVWFSEVAPEALLRGVLGAVVLLLAVTSPAGVATGRGPGRGWGLLAGVVSGGLGVALGINGPPVVAWATRQPWTREALKSFLAAYFLLTGLATVAVQWRQGLMTGRVLALAGWSLPVLLAGVWLGHGLSGRVGEKAFRRSLAGLLAGTGALLLWRATVG